MMQLQKCWILYKQNQVKGIFTISSSYLCCCCREKKELKRQMDRRRTEKINQAKTKEKHLAEEYEP